MIPGGDLWLARPVGLGCMPLSLAGRPGREEARTVLRAAVEAGVTLLDSADAYALDQEEIGHNERLIAEVLTDLGIGRGPGSPVTVATKGGRTRTGGRWGVDARPERLVAACEASLRALGTDCIALYHLHARDPDVPFEESLGALARLREAGKIDRIGLSNVTVDEIDQAGGVVRVDAIQNAFSPWSLAGRRSPVVERCARQGLLFLGHSPFGGRVGAEAVGSCAPLREVARAAGTTSHVLVIALLRAEAPVVVPIPGATRVTTAVAAAEGAELALAPETARAARRALAALPGWPSPLRRAASLLRGLLPA